MKIFVSIFILSFILNQQVMAKRPDLNASGNDTLLLKGTIIKESMENKRGQKLEGVYDLLFKTVDATHFIKIIGGKFLRKDLEALIGKEITVKVVKKFGNLDIDNDDPSYAQTRMGDYIQIIEIIQ